MATPEAQIAPGDAAPELAPVRTSGVARGLGDRAIADRGTADRGTVAAESAPTPSQSQIDQGLVETGVEREDLLRLVRLLESGAGVLLGPLYPGTRLWLRLIRFLLAEGNLEVAQRLFARTWEESVAWVRQLVDQLCPVGWGIAIDASIGATFGVPLQASATDRFSLVRDSATTFKLVRQGVLQGGFDTGIGAGGFLRVGGQGVGASLGAQAQLGLQVTALEEFVFPVFEDPGFAPLLVYLADAESAVRVASLFERALLGLGPDPFRRRVKLEVKVVGGATAQAEAGVRTAPAGTRRVSGSTFTRSEGRSPTLGRGEAILFEPGKGAINFRGVIHSILQGILRGEVTLEAGGGVEIAPTYARDAEGAWLLEAVQLQLYAEGEGAAALTAKLSTVTLPTGPPVVQAGGGIRLTWRATRPFERESIQFVGHELYLKAGDLDVYEGQAHEVILSLPVFDLSAYTSLDAFLAAIDRAVIHYRFPVGSPLGRAYANALASNRTFTVILSPKYREWGFHVVGFLTIRLVMPEEVVTRLLGRVAEFVLDRLEEDPAVQELVRSVLRGIDQGMIPPDLPESAQRAAMSVLASAGEHVRAFLDTGEVPAELRPLLDDLLATLVGAIDRIELRGEIGLGLAAGATVAKGAKVRVHGAVSARIVYQQDIAPLVRDQLKSGLASGADLLAILRRQWVAEPVEVDVPPEQLRSATP